MEGDLQRRQPGKARRCWTWATSSLPDLHELRKGGAKLEERLLEGDIHRGRMRDGGRGNVAAVGEMHGHVGEGFSNRVKL
jgi:hypothetical protein